MNQTQEIVNRFVAELRTHLTNEISDKVADALGPQDFANGHGKLTVPQKVAVKLAPAPKVARRKGPIQLCPAPGCKERAAPVFGMLCSKHKGSPKATVKKWREARRAGKK